MIKLIKLLFSVGFCFLVICSVEGYSQDRNVGNLNEIIEQQDETSQIVLSLQQIDYYACSKDIRQQASDRLIKLANISPENRELIIKKIIEFVEKQEKMSNSLLFGRTLDWWESANYIFSELEAIEAIDIVIKYVNASSPVARSQPARKTLIYIGKSKHQEEALARISEAYKVGDNITKAYMAEALLNIGGKKAKKISRELLKTETDEGIIRILKKSNLEK